MTGNVKKTCVWLSRHEPTNAQRRSLSDYRIIRLNPPGRYWSSADAYIMAQNAGQPRVDLYVVVMPEPMLRHFLSLVHGCAPVVRAVMDYRNGEPVWTGRWEQVHRIQIVTSDWTPEPIPRVQREEA